MMKKNVCYKDSSIPPAEIFSAGGCTRFVEKKTAPIFISPKVPMPEIPV